MMKKMLVAISAVLISAGLAVDASAAAEQATPVEQKEGQPTQEFKSLVRSYRILGQTIKGEKDQDLGKITQILLDPKTGQAVYVIVTSGGVLDIGEQERLVPWQALKIQPQTYAVSLPMTERQFQEAPKGAVISNRQQAEEIYRYYGVSPQWEGKGASGGEPQMEPGIKK